MYKLKMELIDETSNKAVFTATSGGLSPAQREEIIQFYLALSSKDDDASGSSEIPKPYQY